MDQQCERCAQREQHHSDVHLDAGERGADDARHQAQQAEERRQLMPTRPVSVLVPRLRRPRPAVPSRAGRSLLVPSEQPARGSAARVRHVATARRTKGLTSMPASCATR